MRRMLRPLLRAAKAALVGALAAAACSALLYARDPGIALEMDRAVPEVARGVYGTERSGELTFVWTARRADLSFAGLDRRGDWACAVTFRGARSAELPQPDVAVAIDGITAAKVGATNEFQTVEVRAPGRPFVSGLTLSLTSSMTFVPGPSDLRQLGVQLDRVACRPAGSGFTRAPWRATWSAALASALFGAMFGLLGLPAGAVVLGVTMLSVAQAVALSAGVASYTGYAGTLVRLAACIAPLSVLTVWALGALRRQPLHRAARFVVGFSAVALYLKLAALLHPSKALVDALFHAHRFEWVLAGRFYFTQLSTSSTPFPYAIGLYVFAAPWALLTRDHVTLLRVVVCACDVIAGAMIYQMIVRAWGDRLAGAVAAALFSALPISFVVVGNANLTNAFGQAASVVAVAAAVLCTLDSRHPLQWLALTLVATLGLVSHVSILVLLFATLVSLAFLYRWAGGPDVRGTWRALLLATAVSAGLSVALYWGHFGSVYSAQLGRLRAAPVERAADRSPARPTGEPATSGAQGDVPVLGRDRIPLGGRVSSAAAQTLENVGWPILGLAAVGLWRVAAQRRRDRATLAVAAWSLVGVAFVAFSALSASDRRYQQDAWEFIGRVEHAAAPAAVVLAGGGAAWGWRASLATRVATTVALGAAAAIAARAWHHWLL